MELLRALLLEFNCSLKKEKKSSEPAGREILLKFISIMLEIAFILNQIIQHYILNFG